MPRNNSKAGIPNLQDLMPNDLKWSWCNNNRNKAHNKCNVLESSRTTCPVHGKSPKKIFDYPPQSKSLGTMAQRNVYVCSVMSDSAIPWTVAHQAPLSTELSRQEYWNGSPFSPPGDLPNPGIEPTSPALEVDSLPLSHQGSPKE